jgi:hypothetical protein
VQTLYDSNILRLGEGQIPRPDQQKADFRVSPVATATMSLPIGRQQFFAGAQAGADFFGANEQLNRARYALGGGLNVSAGSRCTGQVAANYSSRQFLLSEESEVIPNARNTLSYGASASCQSPAGLGVGVTLRQINNSNGAPGRVAFNVNSTLISPFISYGRPTLGTFSLTANLNYVTYPERQILTPDGEIKNDGANIFTGTLSYQRSLGSKLQLGAGISYLQSNPQPLTILAEDAELGILFPLDRTSFSGLGYNLSVNYTPGSRLSGSLYWSRQANASVAVGALFTVATAFGADINYQLGSSFTLGMGGTYTNRDYSASFSSPTEVVPRVSDDISRVYGRINFNPPKLYNVSFIVAYQNRVSNPVRYSFNSFSALLSIAFDFGSQR